MTVLTRFCLVLLRFAIGWHFLFEGLDKLDSHFHFFHGPVENRTPWSSEMYLREASGPLRELFREQAGDLNAAALERLTLPPARPGKRPELPPALEKDWKNYFDRFAAHYELGTGKRVPPEVMRPLAVAPVGPFPANLPWPGLAQRIPAEGPDKLQLALAQTALDHAKAETLDWLTHGEREVILNFSGVTEKVKETTPDRMAKYRKDLDKLREIEAHGLPAFGKDVWKKKLTALKDKIATERTELLADANRPLKEAMAFTFKYRLTPAQQKKGPVPEPEAPHGRLWWINQVTMWGLTVVGGCLLLGLFTRTACVAGAGFLLMFTLAMPALPWLPANPRAEGHYFFINKNLIEMIALLALATTASGRWAGLDGLIHALGPRRRLRDEPPRGTTQERPVARAPVPRPVPVGPAPPSPVKEPSHGP
jgi:uncharacterized membrane protein YphA (DoxX/SURF4 family)